MGRDILIIDDDPAVRGAFRLILEESDYDVREADNGPDGIALAKQKRPDLVFLDLKMPGMDGVETLRRLHAHDATLKVFIVTAFSNEYLEPLRIALDEGHPFEIASKPLSSAQIRNLARMADQETVAVDPVHRIELTLYVVSLNAEAKQLAEQISALLANLYEAGHWQFEVVEVLRMPEKALENEVFATPMLVRAIPKPVLRLLGDLSKMPAIMAAITTRQGGDDVQTLIV